MKRIINFAVCMGIGLSVMVLSMPKAYADMTWTCQNVAIIGSNNANAGNVGSWMKGYEEQLKPFTYPGDYWFRTDKAASVVCTTANISGSVSASITEAEKQAIADKVINSTRLQNIESYALAARNMLNGSTNGGKSLEAAYDKANTAATNASTAATNAASAVTAANNAKTAAEQPNVFKVVKGLAFTKIMYGEINGSSSGVTAVSSLGSGYTVITGTLSTVGVQRISIGGKNLLFEVVDAPTTSYSASVSLSE